MIAAWRVSLSSENSYLNLKLKGIEMIDIVCEPLQILQKFIHSVICLTDRNRVSSSWGHGFQWEHSDRGHCGKYWRCGCYGNTGNTGNQRFSGESRNIGSNTVQGKLFKTLCHINWGFIWVYLVYVAGGSNFFLEIKSPRANDRGNFLCPVCFSVYLFVFCQVFNLRYDFLTRGDRDFLFGMHTWLMMIH